MASDPGQPGDGGSQQTAEWRWQALHLSPQYETVSAVGMEEVPALKGMEALLGPPPTKIRSVILELHPKGDLMAAVVSDADGRSCVIFLAVTPPSPPPSSPSWRISSPPRVGESDPATSAPSPPGSGYLLRPPLRPMRHVVWCNYDAVSRDPFLLVMAAKWLAGTRCLAVMDGYDHLGLIDHTGKVVHMELSSKQAEVRGRAGERTGGARGTIALALVVSFSVDCQ